MKRTVAILGGDQRQVCLAELLLADGWEVSTWGLERGEAPAPAPLNQALQAEMLIFPLPVCRLGKLNLPLTDTELAADRLWPRLRYHQLLLGGMTKELSPRLMADFGLTMLDYYDREELQVANAIPTAEGALRLAMEETDRTLHNSKCLVIGYGRIGRLLAARLSSLGARVTVAARRYSDLAWIDAWSCKAVHTGQLTGKLGEFDLIFNTVPALVLDAERLKEIRGGCVVLDLASAPGGADAKNG